MNLTQSVSFVRNRDYTQEADGSLTPANETYWRTFARVHAQRGGESNQSDQTEARATYRFWVHRNEGVQEDDIIVWRGQQYNIRFVDDGGPGTVYMMIEAERGVAV